MPLHKYQNNDTSRNEYKKSEVFEKLHKAGAFYQILLSFEIFSVENYQNGMRYLARLKTKTKNPNPTRPTLSRLPKKQDVNQQSNHENQKPERASIQQLREIGYEENYAEYHNPEQQRPQLV